MQHPSLCILMLHQLVHGLTLSLFSMSLFSMSLFSKNQATALLWRHSIIPC
jgi:hypothetical protein